MQFKKQYQETRIFDYITELNSEFEITHGLILDTKSIPSLKQLHTPIQIAERREKDMAHPSNSGHPSPVFIAPSPVQRLKRSTN